MTDHWDDYDQDFDDAPEPEAGAEPDSGPEFAPLEPDDAAWADPAEHEPIAEPDADEPAAAEPVAEAEADVFPPAVDVGELPEPVDGFPWVDAATLGAAGTDNAGWTPPVEPVEAAELAEYAGSEAATFTELADAEDPATATLARWWSTGS